MSKKIVLVFLLSLGITAASIAQSFNKAKMDSLFDVLNTNNKAMGSLVLSQKGKISYKKSIGYSVINDKEKVAANDKTKYRIGSISKMFTATLIFQLVEEGKLHLDERPALYFPEIPNAGLITIGQMMNHSSGIHNFTSDTSYLQWNTQPKTHDEIVKYIAKWEPDFEPGTKSGYSNSNFVLLGYIIESILKQPYNEILQKRIVKKLGLKNTYSGSAINPKNNEAYSYVYTQKWEPEMVTDMSIPGGAGSIVSTPEDMTKFIEALFTNKLLKESSLEKMKTINEGYGMGMLMFPFGEKKAYGHNGGIDGFVSGLAYFPDEQLTVSYCSNGQVYPMNDIMIGVLSIEFQKPYSIPTFTNVTVSREILEKYVGLYSSDAFPLKINISRKDNVLMAQATGQQSFPLEAVDETNFKFDQAHILIIFDAAKGELFLNQGGRTTTLTKEK